MRLTALLAPICLLVACAPAAHAQDATIVPVPVPPPVAAPAPVAPAPGPVAPVLKPGITLRSDGTVGVDSRVPKTVRAVVRAANAIATTPYKWGGGHAKLLDTGYDCSGSVSYALIGGGLLDAPLVSGELKTWGQAGRGRWITVFASKGHVYMEVGGLRYDTSGRSGRQTRWQLDSRGATGYAIRRPAGL